MGISGGEEGARHGPSMMPGGSEDAYERLQPILEAASAHVNGDPCVAYLGPRRHYVKMVHNGIEYGIMQLIAEAYKPAQTGRGLTDPQLATLSTSGTAAISTATCSKSPPTSSPNTTAKPSTGWRT
ncbi:MAG: NAD(P)-binding domain-containing protein [Caldilineaceae bacterium]